MYTLLFLLILLPVGLIRMSPMETADGPPVSAAMENVPPAPLSPSVSAAVEVSSPAAVPAVPVIESAVSIIEEASDFSAADEPAEGRSGVSASIMVFVIYAAIVLILSARQAWQFLIWRRRIHRCPLVADDRILAIFREAKRLTGFRRHVSLRDGSAILSTPASCGGLWNSVLLCPLPEVRKLSDAEVKMLLIHELGHFRSFDNPAGLLMAFGSDLLFFNPFLRFIASRAALVRELECDALVRLHMSAVPRWEAAYARLLLKFQLKASGVPAPGLGATAQCLKLRIEEIAVKSNKIKRVVPLICGVGILAAAAALASPCLLMVAPEASVSAAVATRDVRSAFYPHIPTDARSVVFIEGNRSSAALFSSAGDFLKTAGINLPIEMLGHGVDICLITMPGSSILLLRAPDGSPEFPESLRSFLPSGMEVKSLGSGLFVTNPKNYGGLKKGVDAQMMEQMEALPMAATAGIVARADRPETDGLFLTGWIVEKTGGPAQLRLKLAGIPETMRDRIGGNLAAMVKNLKTALGSVGDKKQLEKAITVLSEAESGLWELGVELTPEVLHSIQASTDSGFVAPDEAEEAVKTSPAPKARAGRSLAEINEYCDTIIGDMEERGKQEAADILADFDRNVAGMKDMPEAESNDFLRRELKKVIWDSYTSAKWKSMRFKDELKDAYRENAEPLSGLQDTFETRVMSAYRFARARAVSTGEGYSASSRQKDEIFRSRAAEQEKRDAKRAREAAEREQQRAAEQEREDAAISGGAAEK